MTEPQSQAWPADRAILFVHGVGNAHPGDYDPLVEQFRALLGDEADRFAFYFLYYDQINAWFSAKTQAAQGVAALVGAIRAGVEETDVGRNLAEAIADFAGDVIWPVLLADARQAVRAAYLAQLQQIVLDGRAKGIRPQKQRISIVAHSLGCFHTYETLHAATADRAQGLSPATWGVRFEHVVLMASPVQLIRSVLGRIGFAVPAGETLRCLSAPLEMPAEPVPNKPPVPASRHTVSITGDLDPIGGHFCRACPDWAYMRLPGQEALVDRQQLLTGDGGEEVELARVLRESLQATAPPRIALNNPHAWDAYVRRNADDLRRWLLQERP